MSLYAGTISLQCTAETAANAEHITLEQAKNHARVDTDADDALITSLIVAARRAAEGKTRRIIGPSAWEWRFNLYGRGPVLIPVSPCLECQNVTVDGTALDPAQYSFIASGKGGVSSPLYASLTFLGGITVGSEVVATLSAGYPAGKCPQAIIQWMLVKITSFYEQREQFAVGTNFHEFSRGFVDSLLDPYYLPLG